MYWNSQHINVFIFFLKLEQHKDSGFLISTVFMYKHLDLYSPKSIPKYVELNMLKVF